MCAGWTRRGVLPRPRSRRRDAGAGHGPAPDGGDQGPVLRLLPRLDGARARGRISHRGRRVGERRSPQGAPRRAARSRRLPHRRGRRLRGRRACAGGGDPAPARGTAGRHRRLRFPACRSARRAWRWRARRRRSTRSCCSDRRDGGASRVIGPSRNSKGRRMRAGNSSTKRAAASSLDRHAADRPLTRLNAAAAFLPAKPHPGRNQPVGARLSLRLITIGERPCLRKRKR